MRFRFPQIAVAVLLLCTLCGAWADGPELRINFAQGVRALFEKDDFAALERMAEELRSSKARFPEGLWKLSLFYSGLNARARNDAEWQRWFARLDAWEKAFPDSITLPPVHADALVDYAWRARGSGFSDTVSDEGWKLFGERLAQARTVLEKAARLPSLCPQWYRVMMTVALGQSWERKEYEDLFAAAVAAEPEYYDFYFGKAYYLLPRWYGEPGDWERFAEEAAHSNEAKGGMELYARIAWSNSGYHDSLFRETAIEWPKMRQGFLDMEKHWPGSEWNLNSFCKFAAEAGDRETVAALLKRIGDKPMMNAWGTMGRFEMAKRLADPEQGGKPQERATLRPLGDAGRAYSVAFSPDGARLAGGFQDGAVVVWDVATRKPLWQPEPLDGPIFTLAFSPDGKSLAAGIGDEVSGSRGSVTVWDTVARKPTTLVDDWNGTVLTVRFAPDGRTLVMAGGPWNKKTEARLLDVATGAVQSLDELNQHNHAICTAAFSPDGRLLATDCNRSITAWDLAEKKVVFAPGQNLRGFVHSLDFSADGKVLAAGYYTVWNAPGGVVLWDMPGFKERKPGIQTPTNGIISLAFSPDGALLVAGGQDQCVRVWQTATGREIAKLFGHEKLIHSVAVSPDGKTIASASFDGTVKLWNMPATSDEAR